MKSRLIVVRFALIDLSLVALAASGAMGQGQTNSQWNTMGDQESWLTTSKDDGGDGPHGGGDGPQRG